MSNTVLDRYNDLINESLDNDHEDNYDYERFGDLDETKNNEISPIRISLLNFLRRSKRAFVNTLISGSPRLGWSDFIKQNAYRYQWLYDHLEDEKSKDLLIKLLAFRTLGNRHVKLPLNTPQFWEMREEIMRLRRGAESMPIGVSGWDVYRTNLRPFGYPFDLFVRGIQTQFQLEQYRCPFDGGAIEVAPGDIVIDAGGCHGDTAFYFSYKTGDQGHVYSFEFLPENLVIFERNLEVAVDYAKQITVVKQPVWDSSGMELFVEGRGPGTKVREKSKTPSALKVETLSIDDLVRRDYLPNIHFVKMDIEGAELTALKGAEKSIRRFKPKLAISIYHKPQDFWEIPQWIDSLRLGYKFYIRHFTIHAEETILFAHIPGHSP